MARNVQKPTIKSEWRGLKGNKWRAWVIINHDGNRYVRTNKEQAHKQYEASMRIYNKLKNK